MQLLGRVDLVLRPRPQALAQTGVGTGHRPRGLNPGVTGVNSVALAGEQEGRSEQHSPKHSRPAQRFTFHTMTMPSR